MNDQNILTRLFMQHLRVYNVVISPAKELEIWEDFYDNYNYSDSEETIHETLSIIMKKHLKPVVYKNDFEKLLDD